MWYILPLNSLVKSIVVAAGVLIFAGAILSVVFTLDNLPLKLSATIYEITNSWMFILLYLFMIFLLMDILRVGNILPKELLFNSVKGSLAVLGIVLVVFVYGNICYYHKEAKRFNFATNKKIDKPLKIILISDLHLGYHNQRKTFAEWVNMLNKEKADIILVAGDIVDISTKPLFEQKVYEEFHRLNAPVYACLGNHEYYANTKSVLEFYKRAGINLLQDTCAEYKNVVIVGRDDRTNTNRKDLYQITKNTDKEKYHILLDHQPYNLEQAEINKMDFQFSGHTHYGQVFPINLIMKTMYEKAYGFLQKGNTKYYISSGLGIWGGKFRIGTKSEYVVLTIEQK